MAYQETVGTAAVQVTGHANQESAEWVLINPTSAGKVYLGTDGTVTTGTGFPLPNNVVTRLPWREVLGDLWLVSDTAGQVVGVLFA